MGPEPDVVTGIKDVDVEVWSFSKGTLFARNVDTCKDRMFAVFQSADAVNGPSKSVNAGTKRFEKFHSQKGPFNHGGMLLGRRSCKLSS